MAIIILMQVLFSLTIAAGVALVIWKIVNLFRAADKVDDYGRTTPGDNNVGWTPPFKAGLAVTVIGIVGVFWWGAATYVSPTEIGVVENQTNGSLTTIGRGLHVWPFDPKVTPLVTHVTTYSFSSKSDGDNSLILGEKEDLAKRIASTSASEGHPIVYFWVKVVAVPSREHIITLHRRYGRGYLTGYVSNNFESAVKTVQGKYQFDYLSENRAKFEREVADELNRRLGIETGGEPLVSVVFVNVLDYDYDKQVNDQLNKIVQANNEAAAAKALVEKANQEADALRKKADGERDAAIAKAAGDRKAIEEKASGDLFAKQKEAEGITAIQNALAASPTYINLQQVQRWNGVLPTYMGGDGPIPFFNVPAPGSTPSPSPTAPAR